MNIKSLVKLSILTITVFVMSLANAQFGPPLSAPADGLKIKLWLPFS